MTLNVNSCSIHFSKGTEKNIKGMTLMFPFSSRLGGSDWKTIKSIL